MRQIFYLMSGAAHLPYLVASLYTLRKYWPGRIVVYAWKESYNIAEMIEDDPRLDITLLPREPAYRGKNDQFLDKILIAQQFPLGSSSVYLDADTTVHGSLQPLFDEAERVGFCATRFNDWISNAGIICKRIKDLEVYPGIPGWCINQVTQACYPSLNGGVWASIPESPVLETWKTWTTEATIPTPTFIADEKVLHLLQVYYDSKHFSIAGMDGRFNCSPIYQPTSLSDEDVVIRHYHGDCNLRPEKSLKGYSLWETIFNECMAQNIGGIRSWIGLIQNKWIDKLGKIGKWPHSRLFRREGETASERP